jgi:hypothetical protein
MMGLKLGREFYGLMRTNTDMPLSRSSNASMREAARLNKWFFFDKGRPLKAAEVYARIESRVQREMRNIAYTRTKAGNSVCIKPNLLRLASMD